MKKQIYTYGQGLRDGLPIGLGYLSVAFGFGIAVVAAGLAPWVAALISMTNETSAGQLAGLEIIARSGGWIELALAQLVINVRYSLMGLTLTQHLDESFTTPWRMLLSFSITDEIFAVATTKPGRIGTRYFAGLATLPYVGWVLGTVLGALAGSLLPSVVSGALGIMLYGMVIAIILPPARREKGGLVAVVLSVALSCIIRYTPGLEFITGGFSVIICAVTVSALAAWLFPVAEDVPADTPPANGEGEVSA